jgi:undecaprenyl phosphate-alpha-L-ara4N flippase subunit ArnE
MAAPAHLTLAALGLLAFCVMAESVQQTCFKAGSNRAAPHRNPILDALTQPLIWTGIALWAAEVIAWIFVLQRAPLSLAYPVMTLTYVGVPLAGMLVLGERPSRRQMAGAALVATGVACVALWGAGS